MATTDTTGANESGADTLTVSITTTFGVNYTVRFTKGRMTLTPPNALLLTQINQALEENGGVPGSEPDPDMWRANKVVSKLKGQAKLVTSAAALKARIERLHAEHNPNVVY